MALVRLRGPLKGLAGGDGEHALEGATIAALLRELESSQPALDGWILDERGRIRRHVNVFVGDESIAFLDGLDTRVDEGATITIVPAVSGG